MTGTKTQYNNNMELTGTLVVKYDIQQVSEKFKKREFVIKTDDKYPQFITLQLVNDKCGLIDTVSVGDELTAQININGRPYDKNNETRYFNSIEAWKIEAKSKTSEPQPINSPDLPVEEDELPF